MQRFLTALFLLTACMILGSCDAPENALRQPWMGDVTFDDNAPAETLQRIAARERTARPLTLRDVPIPPGVDPKVLAQRDADDPRARLRWREAVREIADDYPWDDVLDSVAQSFGMQDPPTIEPEQLDAALRYYIRGRQAAHEQQFFNAVNELERARELDPTSPEILRELARSHLGAGNQSRATETYVRLAVLKPNDSEALFMMGMSAAASGDHQLAVATFGRRLTRDQSFDHDPAGDLLVAYMLSDSLHRLGYDRASIEAATRSLEVPENLNERSALVAQVQSVMAQRGDLLQRIGDAHARLGEIDEAVVAYEIAAEHQLDEPGALLPRMLYAALRSGKSFAAQHELLNVLRESKPTLSDREVRLTAYVAEYGENVHWLRKAVLEMHENYPNEPSLVRAAASLLPADESRAHLQAFIERRPRDLQVVAQLLNWIGPCDLEASAMLTATLIEREPDLADAYARRLVYAVPEPWQLYEVIERQPESPHREVLRSRVHALLESVGNAWAIASTARSQWPDIPMLHWLQLDLVAQLEEPMLIGAVLRDGEAFDDPHTWIVRGRTHRLLNQLNDAMGAGERAVVMLDETNSDKQGSDVEMRATAFTELGRTYLRLANEQNREDDAHRWAREAIDLADQALELDESRDEAFQIMLIAYGPGGPIREPQRFRETVQRLFELAPDSRVYVLGAAEEALSQGRYDDALERLLMLYDHNPHDGQVLELAVSAWAEADQLDDAVRWLDQRLEERPGNPVLLEKRVAVRLQEERIEDVIDMLRDMVEQQPQNTIAIRLLEMVYRHAGRMDEALAYGEQRLLSRPRGVRREVELAAIYGGVGQHDEALDRLAWVAGHAEHASLNHLSTAIGVLARIDTNDPRQDALTIALAESAIEQHREPPLQIYGSALRAMSRQGQFDSRFDRFAEHAARHARQASGASVQSALVWRDLAQALIEDGHAYAAARAVRMRLLSDQVLDPQAVNLLGAVGIAAYAAVPDDEQGDEAVTMIAELAERDRLPQLFAIEGEPTAAEVMFHASGFFTWMGRRDAADRLLKEVIRIEDDNGVAMNNIGYGRIERGMSDPQTIRWIERAYELESDSASVTDTIGWLRYRQGQFEDDAQREGAVTLIERAHEIAEEPSPETLDHLGDVYWRLGKRDEAIDAWREGLAVLDAPMHRQQTTENLYMVQVRGWGLLVEDAERIYDREYGSRRDRLREKIEDAEAGRTPAIALTFQEMQGQD